MADISIFTSVYCRHRQSYIGQDSVACRQLILDKRDFLITGCCYPSSYGYISANNAEQTPDDRKWSA